MFIPQSFSPSVTQNPCNFCSRILGPDPIYGCFRFRGTTIIRLREKDIFILFAKRFHPLGQSIKERRLFPILVSFPRITSEPFKLISDSHFSYSFPHRSNQSESIGELVRTTGGGWCGAEDRKCDTAQLAL